MLLKIVVLGCCWVYICCFMDERVRVLGSFLGDMERKYRPMAGRIVVSVVCGEVCVFEYVEGGSREVGVVGELCFK